MTADPASRAETLAALRGAGALAVLREFPRGSVVVFDHDLRYLSAGGSTLTEVGLSREALEGRTISEVFPADVVAVVEPLYRSALAGTEVAEEVGYAGHRYHNRVVPLHDSAGAIVAAMAIAQEVTVSRSAQQALRESEDRFRSAFDHAPIGMALVDLDGRYLEVNPALCRITGWTSEQLLGRPGDDITHPDDLAADLEVRRRLRAGELTSSTIEKRYRTPTGAPVWASTSVSLAHAGDGAPLYFVTQVLDISERKAAEQQLADERRRLRDAQAIGRIGSWERDLRTRDTLWSATLFELYGFAPGPPGTDAERAWRAIHPDDREQLRARIAVAERTGEPFAARYRLRRPGDGELRWFDVRGEGLRVGGELVRLGGSVADVTEQVHAADSLERARDLALEASRAKSAFLATMSHEIRTPLNAVIGLTELLLDTDLDRDQRDYLTTVHSSGQTLLDLINDVLDWSKIESGALVLEQLPFTLRECVEDAMEAVAAQSPGTELDLLVHLEPDCPDAVVSDRLRLRQILVNLIGNAVKFTERGHVVVRASSPDAAGAGGTAAGLLPLRISVTDTGIGIAADTVERLFGDFTQADESTTRSHGGTGLGLAISQRLARAMGGSISVYSEPGVGSTFTLDLTLRPAPAGTCPPPVVPAALPGRRVLVVDDNPVNRTILAAQLAGWDMHSVEVGSGAAALRLLTEGHRYDVAILDFHMPGMDGGEVLERLAELPAAAAMPVIMLTSVSNREQLLAADHPPARHLTKPVRAAVLRSCLAAVLADPAAAPAEGSVRSAAGPPVPERAARVLLVEDNRVNRTVAKLMLDKLGYRSEVAVDGREALEAVARSPFDVILMDVQMPVLDGLEATRELRRNPPPGPRPWVIALTANALPDDRERCAAAGMDDYLSKPVSRDELAEGLARAPVGAAPASARPASGSGGPGR